jgi:4-hydroxybenzoate polyprenyltransferase
MKTVLAYIRLTRPANLVTAVADIAAGIAVAVTACGVDLFSNFTLIALIRLGLATICLYAGGVVMNDVADVDLDKIERPERPIPSGFASKTGATVFGLLLLILGIAFAYQVAAQSALIALIIALLALLYDYVGKHNNFLGPINMGMCRGGNLLLGLSACSTAVVSYFMLALIPVIYIAAITMISRGEVVGGNKTAIRYASILYSIVIGAIAFVAIQSGANFYFALPFIGLFAFLIFRPLIAAHINPEPINIRSAVKTGVISLIVMDAAIASCFAGWQYGLLVVVLLPVSIVLAKLFAVT